MTTTMQKNRASIRKAAQRKHFRVLNIMLAVNVGFSIAALLSTHFFGFHVGLHSIAAILAANVYFYVCMIVPQNYAEFQSVFLRVALLVLLATLIPFEWCLWPILLFIVWQYSRYKEHKNWLQISLDIGAVSVIGAFSYLVVWAASLLFYY